MQVHVEGQAIVEVASGVFFGKHQTLQRDLSILVLQQALSSTNNEIRILDAMSGCGIRAIRYAMEIPNVRVIANDMNVEAIASLERNIEMNNVQTRVRTMQCDAIDCMWNNRNTFDMIEIDPFGSCSPFLFSAIATIASNGIICATDTDLKSLLGNSSHAHAQCFSQYTSLPVSCVYGKELAIRMILGHAALIASQHNREIEPILSTAIEFFVRIHIRVLDADKSKQIRDVPLAVVYQCSQCQYFQTQNLPSEHICPSTCPVCDANLQIGGPYWNGALHSSNFLSAMKTSLQGGEFLQAKSYIQSISMEKCTSMFYFSLVRLFRPFLSIKSPPMRVFLQTLVDLGHSVGSCHLDPMAFKTDATAEMVYSVAAAWLKHQGYNKQTGIQVAPADVSFQALGMLNQIKFTPPTKCDLDHSRNVPSTIQPTETHEGSGSTWHVHESTQAAIEQAINRAEPGDKIVLCANTYKLDEALRVTKPLILSGIHRAIQLQGRITVLASNVAVQNLTIFLDDIKIPKRVHAVFVGGGRNVSLKRCDVSCVHRAAAVACIGVADGAQVNIVDCDVHDGPQAGIFVGGKSNVCIEACSIHDVSGCGVDVQGGSDCVMIDTRIFNCKKSGVFVHGLATAEISECLVERNGMAAVEVTTQAKAKLLGNTMARGHKGGLLVHSSGIIVSAQQNIITKNSLASVDVRGIGSYAKLTENHFCNGRASGIYVSDHGIVEMSNNIIRGHKRAGIEVDSKSTCIEQNNQIDSNGCPTLYECSP